MLLTGGIATSITVFVTVSMILLIEHCGDPVRPFVQGITTNTGDSGGSKTKTRGGIRHERSLLRANILYTHYKYIFIPTANKTTPTAYLFSWHYFGANGVALGG